MMLTQGHEYQAIFSYLRSLHFHFLEAWVVECVNYYRSNNPNISLEVLKNEVKQQWVLVNLREIKVASLPPDLKSKEKIILNGSYAVQVESMLDSSQSCFSQFQKLMKFDTENLEVTEEREEWNSHKPRRCLTFVLCDGVQEIQGMEYQPINKIRTNDPELLPGFKMVIVGPVECRRGMVLLKDENVRVYGGEVDTLTVSNSLKNILTKRLQLDENDYLENVIPEVQESADGENAQNDLIEDLLSQNNEVFLNVPLELEISKDTKPSDNLQSQVTNEDHLFNQDISYWSENDLNPDNYEVIPKKHSLASDDLLTSSQKRPSLDPELENSSLAPLRIPSSSLDTEIENDIFIDFEELQFPDNKKSKKPVQTKLSSFFKKNEISSNNVIKTAKDYQTSYISDKPFVYLKHIMSMKLIKTRVFTIKAVVLTLKKKISIENDLFNLRATITDGSSVLDVDFCSEILEEFLGFSPSEMTVMMRARETNNTIAQKIKESFCKAQEKLILLNSLMKVKFFKENKIPVVISLEELTGEHLQALKSRNSVAS